MIANTKKIHLFFSLLIFLTLMTLSHLSRAENLTVTLLMPLGQESVRYALTDTDSIVFKRKWMALPTVEEQPPIGDTDDYRGIILSFSSTKEYRLFDGIGMNDQEHKKDDLRLLERWVLQHAPESIQNELLKNLDRQLAEETTSLSTPLAESTMPQQIIDYCQEEDQGDPTILVNCYHRALVEKMSVKEYTAKLEQLIRQLDPNIKMHPELLNAKDCPTTPSSQNKMIKVK